MFFFSLSTHFFYKQCLPDKKVFKMLFGMSSIILHRSRALGCNIFHDLSFTQGKFQSSVAYKSVAYKKACIYSATPGQLQPQANTHKYTYLHTDTYTQTHTHTDTQTQTKKHTHTDIRQTDPPDTQHTKRHTHTLTNRVTQGPSLKCRYYCYRNVVSFMLSTTKFSLLAVYFLAN